MFKRRRTKVDLSVYIFRHGESQYNQPYSLNIDEANDLTYNGAEIVKNNIKTIDFTYKDSVRIWSSPLGRTLHSAKIIKRDLEERCVSCGRVEPSYEIGEVENFSWTLFYPLVNGGEINFNNNRFFVDKTQSNPDNLDWINFFMKNEAHNRVGFLSIPEDYKNKIKSFERFEDVTKRMLDFLENSKNKLMNKTKGIFVTHSGLISFFADVYSEGKIKEIQPGDYINLIMNEKRVYVNNINGLKKGKYIDIIEEFKRRYGK